MVLASFARKWTVKHTECLQTSLSALALFLIRNRCFQSRVKGSPILSLPPPPLPPAPHPLGVGWPRVQGDFLWGWCKKNSAGFLQGSFTGSGDPPLEGKGSPYLAQRDGLLARVAPVWMPPHTKDTLNPMRSPNLMLANPNG